MGKYSCWGKICLLWLRQRLTDLAKAKVGNCPPCPPISYVPEVSEWGRCLDGIPMDGDPFYCISYPVLKCIENKTRTVYPFRKDDLTFKMTHKLSVEPLIMSLLIVWNSFVNISIMATQLTYGVVPQLNYVTWYSWTRDDFHGSIPWEAVIDNILESFPQC